MKCTENSKKFQLSFGVLDFWYPFRFSVVSRARTRVCLIRVVS